MLGGLPHSRPGVSQGPAVIPARDSLASALENRQRERANNLRTTVEARRDNEIAAISAVLDELEALGGVLLLQLPQ